MALSVAISIGDFLDKWTILEIKSERIKDPDKLKNIQRELGVLKAAWEASPYHHRDVSVLRGRLKAINEKLWEIEDHIRVKESQKSFDAGFVDLARAVYHTNDQRAAVKRELNLALGSGLIEEKSYHDYSAQ